MGREEAARLAREELADPVYGQAEPSLVERIYTWVVDRLTELVDSLGGALPGGWWVLGPLIAAVVLLVAGLLVYLRPARRSRRRGAVVDSGAPLSAADHRALAERHAAAGAYAEAIGERLRAVSRELEDRAVIVPRAGRTATELAAEATAALPEHRAALAEAARVFNDVRYGEHPATADGYAVLRDLDDRLRAGTPRLRAERTP
ncbi:hypothetical protein DEF23_12085 [Marinitenerispora sediminis]|uniref:Protein-glutamine gamma-glutamyltransferase-like C-terminal domain-containing protein n=1 Tax=Marinitenerispora sediminis TaxID=1931232 RepID=A0A368T3G0_9ACTN|nr:hypothetical protein DEF28_05280 [Marinitenerispora sediminis]RCV56742.1 hypothetical protein DEF23_12085 [Marinitenerispora sediminis]RCV56770.1 hypothetical protein DEF24_16180 [Marinitenerispora sediminis]